MNPVEGTPIDSVDRRKFWDQKIVGWERKRYGDLDRSPSFVERVLRPFGNSVRFRFELASQILRPHVAGRRVVELGCGTGRLAPVLLNAGAREYAGFDLSESAIEQARLRMSRERCSERAGFDRFDVAALPKLDADIVVSLGLLDWLDDTEVARVFDLSAGAQFLHSYSEERASLSQILHRSYVHLSYGHRTRGYVPTYHRTAELQSMARFHSTEPVFIVRDQRLSFGALITTFPPDR